MTLIPESDARVSDGRPAVPALAALDQPWTASAPRVPPNAAHAFGGIWRLTARRLLALRHWLVLLGLLALLVICSLPATANPVLAARNFLPWASRFYVCFLAPVMAFIGAAGVMRDDLRSESVDYIFTRPIRRPLFVLFRFAAHVACAQIEFLLALAVVIGIGLYHGVAGVWSAVPMLLSAQVLAIIAFSGFGFLCGLLSSRYIIIGLAYGAIIEAGIGNVPTQLNQLSMVRHLMAIMRPILGSAEAGLATAAEASSLTTSGAVTALIGFAAIMLAATIALFSFRELAAAGREA